MATEFINGVRTSFGVVTTEKKTPAEVVTSGIRRELKVTFDYANLPGPTAGAAYDAVQSYIPAGAIVTAAYMRILTSFSSTSGTTVIDVGTKTAAGAAIQLAGLINDVGGAADGSNVGHYVGAGVSIGVMVDPANDAYITVTPSVADLTAGKAVLVVEYVFLDA